MNEENLDKLRTLAQVSECGHVGFCFLFFVLRMLECQTFQIHKVTTGFVAPRPQLLCVHCPAFGSKIFPTNYPQKGQIRNLEQVKPKSTNQLICKQLKQQYLTQKETLKQMTRRKLYKTLIYMQSRLIEYNY